MAFFTVLGIFVSIMIVAYWFLVGITYINNDNVLQVTLYQFGVIIPKNDALIKNMNTLRKTKGKTIFINAPQWFNNKVWNVGGVK